MGVATNGKVFVVGIGVTVDDAIGLIAISMRPIKVC